MSKIAKSLVESICRWSLLYVRMLEWRSDPGIGTLVPSSSLQILTS